MASLMRCKRFTIGVTSMTKSSFGGTFEKTALVEGQRWRKVQVPGNKLCLEGYQAFAVTTKEQYAIAQNPVGQRKRGIVQQNEVHTPLEAASFRGLCLWPDHTSCPGVVYCSTKGAIVKRRNALPKRVFILLLQ